MTFLYIVEDATIGELKVLITNIFLFERGIFGLRVTHTENGKGMIIIIQNLNICRRRGGGAKNVNYWPLEVKDKDKVSLLPFYRFLN